MPPTIRAPAFLLSPQKAHVEASSTTYVFKSPCIDGTAAQALLRLHAQAPQIPAPLYIRDDDASDNEVGEEDEDEETYGNEDIPEPASAGGTTTTNSSSESNSLFPIVDANSSSSSVATTNVGDGEDEPKAKPIVEDKREGRIVGRRGLSDEVDPFRGCFDEADFDGKKTKNWEADPFYSPFPKLPSLEPVTNFIRRLSISSSSSEQEEVPRVIPVIELFANIVPPTVAEAFERTPVRAPYSLYATTHMTFHRQKFIHLEEVSCLRQGVQVIKVRAMSRQTSMGLGLLPGSVWVAKAVDRSTQEYQEAREMLKAEVQAYKRISEAEKKDKPGFEFIMNLEAVLADATRNYLILAEMKMDLRVWLACHREESTAEQRGVMIAQALIGLATLHSIGIVHRDFKPENLFIDWNSVVKVGDFGCGVITRGYEPLCGDEYAYEGLAGTWPYMAPEQFDDIYGFHYGISTDYWAFGLVLLEVERSFYTKSVPLQNKQVHGTWLALNDKEDYEGMETFLRMFEVTENVRSLALGLLLANKTKRFGFKEVVNHPYFDREDGTTHFHHLCDHRALGLFARVKTPIEDPQNPEEILTYRASGTHLNWINPRGAFCPGPWRY